MACMRLLPDKVPTVGSARSGIIQIGQSMRSSLLVLPEQDTDMVSISLMDDAAVVVQFARR